MLLLGLLLFCVCVCGTVCIRTSAAVHISPADAEALVVAMVDTCQWLIVTSED